MALGTRHLSAQRWRPRFSLLAAALLVVVSVAGRAGAQPATPGSLISEAMLQSYRGEGGCSGRMRDKISNTLLAEDALAEGLRFNRDPQALLVGQNTATDYDRAAQAAAEKGCLDLARGWWQELLNTFSADAYEALRDRAQAGLAHLDRATLQQANGTGGSVSR